ncbi:DUF7537 family lipoprotein [Halorientalis halophila]|uniref:DUF7537 family lipoprotein n=1 Tax=Halorientalis halophila TaxID=3108499 RepID=UPI00300BB93C
MRTRVLTAVAVAALVALAGCSAGPFGGPGTETAADSDDQAVESETATVSSFAYPAGASPSGIENVSTLLDEHEATLSGSNVTLEGNVSISFMSERVGPTFTIAHEAASNETLTTVTGESGDSFESYLSPDVQAYRVEGDAGVEYGTSETSVDAGFTEGTPESFTGRTILASIIGPATYNATGVVTRDGTELVRYELVNASTTPGAVLNVGNDTDSGGAFAGDTDVSSDVEGTLLVDSDGLIHEAHYRATSGGNGGFSSGFGVHVSFTDVGETSVERPDWTGNV